MSGLTNRIVCLIGGFINGELSTINIYDILVFYPSDICIMYSFICISECFVVPCVVSLVIKSKLSNTNLGYIQDHSFLWSIFYSYSKCNSLFLSCRKGFNYKCCIKFIIECSGACNNTFFFLTGYIFCIFRNHIFYEDIGHIIVRCVSDIDRIINGISVLNYRTCCRVCGFVNFKAICQFDRIWCFCFYS